MRRCAPRNGRSWGGSGVKICETADNSGSALSFDTDYGSAYLRDWLLAAWGASSATPVRTYSFPLGAKQHEAGTTPLARVLDEGHEFRAIRGLFAAGPSSFRGLERQTRP
jgi:hypothetical protein